MGLVGVLLFALVVAVFAIQNAEPVRIAFLWWTIPRFPEALVILGSVLLGAMGALLARGWHRWRKRRSVPPHPPLPPVEVGESTAAGGSEASEG